jgi:Type II CAAX prenyl endopeptidase Rce1-like
MTLAVASDRYWRAARAPRYSLTFAFPLLALYEALAFTLSQHSLTGVRNGADVMLKSVFLVLGGRNGLVVFGALLVGTGAVLVWRDRRRSGPLVWRVFLGMAAESVVYALLFGTIVGTLTGLLLYGLVTTGVQSARLSLQAGALGLATQLMISLGAGIYEELLFRVLLVGVLAWAGRRLLGWSAWGAGIFAAVAGALIFSAFHYVGPYCDRLEVGSFAFRAVAGLLFSGLYLMRGFGITAWTHALYDVFLALTVLAPGR